MPAFSRERESNPGPLRGTSSTRYRWTTVALLVLEFFFIVYFCWLRQLGHISHGTMFIFYFLYSYHFLYIVIEYFSDWYRFSYWSSVIDCWLVLSAHLAHQPTTSRIENLKHNPGARPGANSFESSSPKNAEDTFFESAPEKFEPTRIRTRAPKQRLFPKASVLPNEPNAAPCTWVQLLAQLTPSMSACTNYFVPMRFGHKMIV